MQIKSFHPNTLLNMAPSFSCTHAFHRLKQIHHDHPRHIDEDGITTLRNVHRTKAGRGASEPSLLGRTYDVALLRDGLQGGSPLQELAQLGPDAPLLRVCRAAGSYFGGWRGEVKRERRRQAALRLRGTRVTSNTYTTVTDRCFEVECTILWLLCGDVQAHFLSFSSWSAG